ALGLARRAAGRIEALTGRAISPAVRAEETARWTPAPPPSSTRSLARPGRANLSTAELYELALRENEGLLAANGPLVVRTGEHTGRSPQDKFIVDEPSSSAKVWWGDVNHRISEEHYDRLRARLMTYVKERD